MEMSPTENLPQSHGDQNLDVVAMETEAPKRPLLIQEQLDIHGLCFLLHDFVGVGGPLEDLWYA